MKGSLMPNPRSSPRAVQDGLLGVCSNSASSKCVGFDVLCQGQSGKNESKGQLHDAER